MSENPVPIPSGAVPADIPDWRSVDAAAWRKAGPAPWARPLWSALALFVTVAAAVGAEPEPVCSDAVPCGPDWVGLVQVGLVMGLLYWLVRLPELVLVAAPVAAVLVAFEQFPAPGEASLVANAAVLAALALGWAAAWARLAARRGQRRLAESAAGVRHRLPEPAGPLRRGVFLLAAGAVLCAVAGSAVGQGLSGVRADERRAAGAERVTAEVTGRDDASVRLRTDDARSVTVDAEFPEDYPVGTTLTVLEDGPWRRLAAEPYDPWAWQLLALAAGLPGISLLTTGVLAYRRGAALRRGPVPALRVLERVDRDGRSWIHATDDPSGRTPLFSCHCARVLPDEGKHAEHTEEDEDGDDDRAFDTRLYEAVVFGAPYEGGELVFLAAGSDGDPVVTRTVGPVRLPGTGRGRMGHGPKPAAEGESAGAELPPDDRVAEVAAALKPTGRPMRWGAGRVARIYGLALTAGMVSGIKLAVDAVAADGFRWDNLFRFGLIFLIGPAAVLLNWRITADSAGLWLTGVWKVRHVPWERLRAVRYTAYGSVEVRVRGEDPWQLSLPAWHWAARRLGLRLPYTRMFEELAALHAHPELRPTEQSPPRGRGLPMGPALALLLGLLVLLPFLG